MTELQPLYHFLVTLRAGRREISFKPKARDAAHATHLATRRAIAKHPAITLADLELVQLIRYNKVRVSNRERQSMLVVRAINACFALASE